MIAVLAALAAAASFGAGSALQHQQAHQASTASVPPHRALARLARRRRWLAGIALAAAAYGWQATALAFGPLALVAPIAATDLVFALALALVVVPAPAQAGLAWVQARGGWRRVLSCRLPPSPGRSAASAAGWLPSRR